jgi:hypothetical protein
MHGAVVEIAETATASSPLAKAVELNVTGQR